MSGVTGVRHWVRVPLTLDIRDRSFALVAGPQPHPLDPQVRKAADSPSTLSSLPPRRPERIMCPQTPWDDAPETSGKRGLRPFLHQRFPGAARSQGLSQSCQEPVSSERGGDGALYVQHPGLTAPSGFDPEESPEGKDALLVAPRLTPWDVQAAVLWSLRVQQEESLFN